MSSSFRSLPSVDLLVRDAARRMNGDALPHAVLVGVARALLDETRSDMAAGASAPSAADLAAELALRARAVARPSLQALLNGTGVIIQTNLGRAPLSEAALAAMRAVGQGYANLEYDLEAGTRGSRSAHLTALLCHLTGAEDALVVNNNAAALYLVLIALAAGREVVVSRGQAVEIGGGFRIPDVMRQSGAALVEVGTTNRTYQRDYEAAITDRTALLLRVHSSNFRLSGFVHETALAEIVAVGRARGVAVLDDLGSGSLLATTTYGLAPEPTVAESVAAGADLVTFSGDKLLGGPQSGLIVGRAEYVARLKTHPLARALRVDKTTIAALEATLLAYLHGRAPSELPVWRMIAAPLPELRTRAERIAAQLGCLVAPCESAVGGGALPGQTLASWAVALDADRPDELARRLRLGEPAVVGRIVEGRVLLDVRTILPEQDDALIAALGAVMQRAR